MFPLILQIQCNLSYWFCFIFKGVKKDQIEEKIFKGDYVNMH